MAGSNTLCREQLQNTFTGECQTEPKIAGSMPAPQEVVTAYEDDPDPVSWEEFIQEKKAAIGPDAAQTISTFFEPLQQGVVLIMLFLPYTFQVEISQWINVHVFYVSIYVHSYTIIMLVQIKETAEIIK